MFDPKKITRFLYTYEELQRHIEQLEDAIAILKEKDQKATTSCMVVFGNDMAGVYVSNEFALPIFKDDLEKSKSLLQEMSNVLEKTGL